MGKAVHHPPSLYGPQTLQLNLDDYKDFTTVIFTEHNFHNHIFRKTFVVSVGLCKGL